MPITRSHCTIGSIEIDSLPPDLKIHTKLIENIDLKISSSRTDRQRKGVTGTKEGGERNSTGEQKGVFSQRSMVGSPGYGLNSSLLVVLLDNSEECVQLAAHIFRSFEKKRNDDDEEKKTLHEPKGRDTSMLVNFATIDDVMTLSEDQCKELNEEFVRRVHSAVCLTRALCFRGVAFDAVVLLSGDEIEKTRVVSGMEGAGAARLGTLLSTMLANARPVVVVGEGSVETVRKMALCIANAERVRKGIRAGNDTMDVEMMMETSTTSAAIGDKAAALVAMLVEKLDESTSARVDGGDVVTTTCGAGEDAIEMLRAKMMASTTAMAAA